jgi:indole-3-glycerol phosphate synthase
VSRFSQAISEGDGISVIPLLDGDVATLAAAAELAGAEAVAVRSPAEVERVRAASELPVLVLELIGRAEALRDMHAAGADACVLVFEQVADDDVLLEDLYAEAAELELDCALDVRDEDELEQALERVDPEILILSERDPEKGEEELERTLDLLPDVPAGKLVISGSRVVAREQVLALERAGVDAVLVGAGLPPERFGDALAVLTGYDRA